METLALAYRQRENRSRWSQFWVGVIDPIIIDFISKPTIEKLNQDNNDNRKKGGRPKKSPVHRKSKTIGVCFSEPELYAIRHRAKQANLPLSIYCHDAVLDGIIKEPLKKEELDVLRSLSNMGNNLNQLTKIAKFLSEKRLENQALPLLESIQDIINKLSDDWKNSKRKKF
ncbi:MULTISPECIES: hypothetical protein [Proteiniphilum]|uniref:plasmid mobilization protein n=1 Tax=Proteiniphilum TaxID=294702 RepID=UPI000A5A0950|nr:MULTISPECIES: hypothetical protein [Proteiniphilum]MDY9917462.1 hypothetical protein [Proteiniphilum sp.]